MTQNNFTKHIFSAILLLLFSNIVSAQDTTNGDWKKQFLINPQTKLLLTTNNILANFRRVDDSWFSQSYTTNANGEDNYSEPSPFESAYNLNVFDYYELNETYDSKLKKDVFKQSNQYKTLLDSLKKVKDLYLNSIYFETNFNSVGGQTFDLENTDGPGYQVNYDIQKKGFSIAIGEVFPYHCQYAFCPKVIEGIEFKQLTITKKYNLKSNSKKSYTQYLFIPMDATTALKVENNRSQIQILRIFSMKGLYSPTFNDEDFAAENYKKPCKIKLIKGGNMRLFIYNKKTYEVYFDKIYPAT